MWRIPILLRKICRYNSFGSVPSPIQRPLPGYILPSATYPAPLDCFQLNRNCHQSGSGRDWISRKSLVTLIFPYSIPPFFIPYSEVTEIQCVYKVQCNRMPYDYCFFTTGCNSVDKFYIRHLWRNTFLEWPMWLTTSTKYFILYSGCLLTRYLLCCNARRKYIVTWCP